MTDIESGSEKEVIIGPKQPLNKLSSVEFLKQNEKEILDDLQHQQDGQEEDFFETLISEGYTGQQKDINKTKYGKMVLAQQTTIQLDVEPGSLPTSKTASEKNKNSSQNLEEVKVKKELTREEKWHQELDELKKQILEDRQKQNWQEAESKKNILTFKILDDNAPNQIWNYGKAVLQGEFNDFVKLKTEYNYDHAKVYQTMLKDAYLLEEYDGNMKLAYSEVSPPIGKNISSFVLFKYELDEEKGEFTVWGKGIQKPDNIEIKDLQKKKLSDVQYDGFIVKKLDENQIQLESLSKLNVDGMPNWIKNRVRNNRAYEIMKKIQEYLEKCEKKRIKELKKQMK